MAKMSKRQRARLIRYGFYAATVGLLVWLAFAVDWPKLQQAFFDPEIFADLFPEIVTVAAKNTLIYAFGAFVGGVFFGLLLALMKLSPIRPYRWAATLYIELFRGIPAIITLILVGFVLPIALGVKVPGTYGPGIVALVIVASAYLAETIRAGIQAVPKGQLEAARSLGMTSSRAMISVVIPQAFRIIIPPLTNEFVLLLKDTSLVFVLGVTPDSIELA